jgi:RNA polymerase sigma-70 factor (ECF subfamily)
VIPVLHDPQRSADIELRDRFLEGDPEAARDLCERHLDDLYAFVHWRVGGDRARAEDLVQDTLLVALQRIASFDGRARLSTWLEGIARNRLRSERRRRRPVPLEDVLSESEGEIDAILAQVAREPLPEWVLEEQETKDLVGATLSSLPEDQRRILLDKYVEGLSTREIAARRSASEKATESRLGRARLAFARVFELFAKRRGGIA